MINFCFEINDNSVKPRYPKQIFNEKS